MLQAAAEVCGYEYDDEEWQEIGRAVLATQQKVTEKLNSFVKENSDLYGTVQRSLKDGNEAIFKVVDPYISQGLKKLLNK